MTTQLIRTIRKFDGTDFVTWERTLHATASVVYYCPEICEILDGQLGSELTYQTRRGPGMPATRGVTTMTSLLADVKEVEELTAGGEIISAFLSNVLCGNRSTDNELARMLLNYLPLLILSYANVWYSPVCCSDEIFANLKCLEVCIKSQS